MVRIMLKQIYEKEIDTFSKRLPHLCKKCTCFHLLEVDQTLSPLFFHSLNASLCEKLSYACFKHHSLVYVSFLKKSARRSLCTKDLLLPKGSSKLEDTPCKLYKLTCKHPCMTTSFFFIQEDLYVCKLNFNFHLFIQELTLLNLKFSYASFLEYACFNS